MKNITLKTDRQTYGRTEFLRHYIRITRPGA